MQSEFAGAPLKIASAHVGPISESVLAGVAEMPGAIGQTERAGSTALGIPGRKGRAQPLGGFTKRLLDIVLATAILIVAAPIMLAVAALIRVIMGGPVLFSQQRLGFNGRVFICYKYRSMAVNAALAAMLLILPRCVLAAPSTAVATNDFLDSIGVVTTFPDRGQPLAKTIEMVRYCGFRWVRAGIEGLTDKGPTTIQTFLDLHRETGVRFSWGLVSGGTDVKKLVETAKVLAEAGALLALEGNNEPNNWGVIYRGEKGGGREPSWMAVAKLQRDMYQVVKSDPVLAKYPVWSISEPGAQRDNVGLQFLTIPPGAKALMPDGTKYADYANVHNYIYHPRSPRPMDNQTWNAADSTAASKVDGLFGNFGITWRRRFRGYTQEQLDALPRVTTETGAAIEGPITEQIHGLNLMSIYLAQFKRGVAYSSVYLLRDRTDEGGNQSFGFFKPDYTPRKAALYLHNLTTILADKGPPTKPGQLDYAIADQPETVHDLLLRHSDGTFQLVVWGERLIGQDRVTVRFGVTHASVKLYNPTIGVEPVHALTNVNLLELTLRDHPIIIVISPPRQ